MDLKTHFIFTKFKSGCYFLNYLLGKSIWQLLKPAPVNSTGVVSQSNICDEAILLKK